MDRERIYPRPLQTLAEALRRLPGVGRRTAERMALAFLEWSEADLAALGTNLAELKRTVRFCELCGNLSDREQCRICTSAHRDRSLICVVETAVQIPVIEGSGGYRGLYHVLGGRLQPLEGRGPEDLRVAELKRRLADPDVRELILATSSDVEGEATAHFLAEDCARPGLAITRIASGVPVGADLSYADAATVAMALGARRAL